MKRARSGARAVTGHRIGEWHPRSKHEDALVVRARALRESGMTYADIGKTLGVHWRTVADWVNYDTRYSAS